MLSVASAHVRRMLGRLREQAGLTIIETMVAAVILSAGVLGVFVMIEVADAINRSNRGRETATSLARELLEDAHSTAYASVGDNNWFNATLTALDGRSSNVQSPTAHSAHTTVDRRGVTYSVDVDTCSVDDGRDGYGTHSGAVNWCTDSTSTAGADSAPEDLKRVAVTLGWSDNGKSFSIYQTATFSSAGTVVGPYISEFKITTPTGLEPTAPVITTNPTNGNVIFQATSSGAADMKFSVDGVEQTSGSSGGNGTWNYTWNITNLKDGVYTIGATAIDALGTRGDPQVIQVKLARGVPSVVTNVTGGYNDVFSGGSTARVVELGWDASPEGTVTGYEVWKGATQVCTASVALECMDLNPATSGSTVYTIKTLYTDASGNAGSVSTTYSVTAPAGGASTQQFWHATSTGISQTLCVIPTGKQGNTGSSRDALGSAPAGTDTTWTNAANGNNNVGCIAPFTTATTMTASTTGMTVSGWFKNTSATQCRLGWQVFKNGSLINGVAGTGYGGGSTNFIIPGNVTVPTLYTAQLGTTAQSFVAGDQLSIIIGGFAQSATGNICTSTTMYYNSSTHPVVTTLPLSGGSGGSGSITKPATPTGLAGVANGDGTTTLTWTPPSGSPAAEFYRIYRDGINYTNRYDTAGDTGQSSITWTDTSTGSTTHVYRVTAASNVFAESSQTAPLTR